MGLGRAPVGARLVLTAVAWPGGRESSRWVSSRGYCSGASGNGNGPVGLHCGRVLGGARSTCRHSPGRESGGRFPRPLGPGEVLNLSCLTHRAFQPFGVQARTILPPALAPSTKTASACGVEVAVGAFGQQVAVLFALVGEELLREGEAEGRHRARAAGDFRHRGDRAGAVAAVLDLADLHRGDDRGRHRVGQVGVDEDRRRAALGATVEGEQLRARSGSGPVRGIRPRRRWCRCRRSPTCRTFRRSGVVVASSWPCLQVGTPRASIVPFLSVSTITSRSAGGWVAVGGGDLARDVERDRLHRLLRERLRRDTAVDREDEVAGP